MPEQGASGCAEYRSLSRRQFLAASGGALAAAGSTAWLPRVVLAMDECTDRDIIVSIFLRGASDGLTMCVPHGEDAYYAARPVLNVPRPDSGDPNAAVDLDGFFGFPPSMAPLVTAFGAGHLLLVHACGSTDPSRSHFDAQRFMEVGKPADPALFSGWLGRHLATAPPLAPGAQLRGVGIGYGLQRTLQSAPLAIPIPDLDGFGLTGNNGTKPARSVAIGDMYALVDDPVRAAAQTTQATIDLLNTIDFAGYTPGGGALYPSGSFGTAIKSTAALIKADVGVEAIAIDVGGWDTHNNQGPLSGTMATLMTTLSSGLAAFHADMFAGNGRNFVVVIMSEFGRRLQENFSQGTDHGHGNVMMLLGSSIAGGRVMSNWPGLQPEQLFEQRDLEVTIDFRDILAEVVHRRLRNPALDLVFPDYVPTFRGVTTSCRSADLDIDGDVDGDDVNLFAGCAAGAGVPHDGSLTCQDADLDGDGDGDQDDFGAMQRCISGPGVAPQPGCAG